MSRTLRALSCLIALVAAGCDHAGPGAEHREEGAEKKRVVVVRPVRRSIARSVSQPADVYALNDSTLYAQVAGYLSEIAVDKGDQVTKGQVLATIAVPELLAEKKQVEAAKTQAEAELASANVALDRAESTRTAAEAGVKRAQADVDLQKQLYDRAKDLRSDGVVSQQDLEIANGRYKEADASVTLAQARLKEAEGAKREAESQIEVAKAKVDTARAQIDRVEARISYSQIRAPFKGIIVQRFVDPGAMIQQATASSTQASPIVSIVEIDRVRVDFKVPEADVASVASGQRVSLRVDSYPGRTFEGHVTRFAGALDRQTRTLLVEAEYENPRHELRPGMFGDATIELERHDRALTLPAEAIRTHEHEKSVFVAEGGVAKRKKVTVGIDSGATVEVLSGLAEQDAVVLGGHLADGVPVVAIERTEDKKEAEKE